MSNLLSFEGINSRLDELHQTEKDLETKMEMIETEKEILETEKAMRDSLNKATTSEKEKIIEGINIVNNRILAVDDKIVASNNKIVAINYNIMAIRNERSKLLGLMKEQEDIVRPPEKKMRRSFPTPTSGSQWTYEILHALLIDLKNVYSIEEFLFDRAPNVSDRAKHFTDACSTISFENLRERKFPSDDHHANWLAKHLFVKRLGEYCDTDASVDDIVYILFDALGFNHGDLISVSRNRLTFKMDNKLVSAEADLTVFNLKSFIRLAVVQEDGSSEEMNGEPQLIAEAIAAAMYNQEQFQKRKPRNNNDSTAQTTTMMSSASMSNMTLFMIRMSGTRVYFYSHKFSDDLLDRIAKENLPLDYTEIQKFARIDGGGRLHHDFMLLYADDRAIIFQILDSIQ